MTNWTLGPSPAATSSEEPDPLLLPIATTAQIPLTTAYDALDVPSLAAGQYYYDPTTNVKIWKLTSATYPATSANWGHDYGEGNNEISLPHTGTTRTILVNQNGTNPRWLIDFTPGVGVSNARQLTGNLAPQMDINFTFSSNASTPQYAYVVNSGGTIRRVNIVTMAEAAGGVWPHTGETWPFWFHQSADDGLFVWMSSNTIVGYEPGTDTRKTYTASNIDQPGIDRAGRYIGVGFDAGGGGGDNSVYVWDWQTDTILWTTDGSIPWIHNANLRRRWYNINWNGSWPTEFTNFEIDVVDAVYEMGGPSTSNSSHGNGNWIQYPADLDDQWALFTHYGSLRPAEAYWLAPGGMVLITANGQRRLLGHSYNTSSTYEFYPFGKMASDGKYAVFTSNMNGSGRADVFLAELPLG